MFPYQEPQGISSNSPNVFRPFPITAPPPLNIFQLLPNRPLVAAPNIFPPQGNVLRSNPNLFSRQPPYPPMPHPIDPPYLFHDSRRMLFHQNGPYFMHIGPHSSNPFYIISKKKTIDNLGEFNEEKEITQTILEKDEQKNCIICLEDFVLEEKIIYLPCFHYYHSDCIKTWVISSDKYPICNNEIKLG